jgi:hypothetical protein
VPTLTSTTLGRFCRELAGGLDELPTLLREWGVDPAQFEVLQRSPAFELEMRAVQAEMADLGNDAGYIYRMKSLSEQMLPDFVKMMQDPATPTSTRFDMIKWAAEMARLKEKPAKNDPLAGPRGPSVTFHFGPGLPIQSMTVGSEPAEVPRETPRLIDVTPAPKSFEGFDFS